MFDYSIEEMLFFMNSPKEMHDEQTWLILSVVSPPAPLRQKKEDIIIIAYMLHIVGVILFLPVLLLRYH